MQIGAKRVNEAEADRAEEMISDPTAFRRSHGRRCTKPKSSSRLSRARWSAIASKTFWGYSGTGRFNFQPGAVGWQIPLSSIHMVQWARWTQQTLPEATSTRRVSTCKARRNPRRAKQNKVRHKAREVLETAAGLSCCSILLSRTLWTSDLTQNLAL